MRSRCSSSISTVIVFVSLGTLIGCGQEQVTQPRVAPTAARTSLAPGTARYRVTILHGVGVSSRGNAINASGVVAGFANLPNGTRHAVLWQNGEGTDLGTLGGPNSSVQWPGIDNSGWVVGIAETAAMDPLGEDWSCSAFFPSVTHHVCRGFVWHDGVITPLPTFGGTHGFATEVNNHGQVVGWAETAVHDPTCNAPQVLQFRAALWEPQRGAMRQLRPLPGDSTSAATAINDRGQAVGISGACDVAVGEFSAIHSVLWDADGRPTELPNLGGEAWHTPMDINEAGDVAGFSNPPGVTGGVFDTHAFLWTRDAGIVDLGVLPGDEFSEALGINARRQIVGVSCGDVCHPALWENGAAYNLNDLLGAGYPNVILSARHINNLGQITGNILEASTGQVLPFIATPTDTP
jgi:probable HAF family extracellular repeat protein